MSNKTDCVSKQKLIDFLKNKIKFYEEDMENTKNYLDCVEMLEQVLNDIHTSKCIISTLEEIIDFINEEGTK